MMLCRPFVLTLYRCAFTVPSVSLGDILFKFFYFVGFIASTFVYFSVPHKLMPRLRFALVFLFFASVELTVG